MDMHDWLIPVGCVASQVAVTLFWLGRTVQKLPSYCGPQLDLDRSALGEIESPVKVCVCVCEC